MTDWSRVRFFKKEELIEPEKLRPTMIYAVDELRVRFGRSLIITSSYRSGASGAHGLAEDGFYSGLDLTTGTAMQRADRRIPATEMWALVTIAMELGFVRIGCYDRHLHLDMERHLPHHVLWVGVSS